MVNRRRLKGSANKSVTAVGAPKTLDADELEQILNSYIAKIYNCLTAIAQSQCAQSTAASLTGDFTFHSPSMFRGESKYPIMYAPPG